MRRNILIGLFSVALLSAAGLLVYITQQPAVGESFTNFYILGRNKDASAYPTELIIGQPGKVTLFVENHEKRAASYKVDVLLNDAVIQTVDAILLGDGKKWESEISFLPVTAGTGQSVKFQLFIDEEKEVYRALLLLVDVK